MTKADEGAFLRFSNWLRSVNTEADLGLTKFDIEDFEITYDDLLAAYPRLRDAPPEQTGP